MLNMHPASNARRESTINQYLKFYESANAQAQRLRRSYTKAQAMAQYVAFSRGEKACGAVVAGWLDMRAAAAQPPA